MDVLTGQTNDLYTHESKSTTGTFIQPQLRSLWFLLDGGVRIVCGIAILLLEYI